MEKWCNACGTKTNNWRYIKDSSYVVCDGCSEDLEAALITLIEKLKEKEEELINLYEELDYLKRLYEIEKLKKEEAVS